MTRSIPSISSSGNMSPLSTMRMSSPSSSASMFLPISPTPPSGMTRTGALATEERHLVRRLGWLGRHGGSGREEDRERGEIRDHGRPERWRPERGRGMEHREDADAVDDARLAVDAADRLAGQPLAHGEAAERHDDAGPQGGKLLGRPPVARRDLERQRVAVVRRPVPHDVRDEDLRAVEADDGEELVEEVPGRAHEGAALLVLVEAGRLAEEEDPALGAPLARYGPLRGPPEGAGPALAHLTGDGGERFGHSPVIIRATSLGSGHAHPAGAFRARYSTSVYGRRRISMTSARNPARWNIASADSRDGKLKRRRCPRVSPRLTAIVSCAYVRAYRGSTRASCVRTMSGAPSFSAVAAPFSTRSWSSGAMRYSTSTIVTASQRGGGTATMAATSKRSPSLPATVPRATAILRSSWSRPSTRRCELASRSRFGKRPWPQPRSTMNPWRGTYCSIRARSARNARPWTNQRAAEGALVRP